MEELAKKSTAMDRRSNNIIFKILIIVAVSAVVVLGGWYIRNNYSGSVSGVNPYTYQAVFLTNGQAYFGKLSTKGKWLLLTDIYYLQATDSLQQSSTPTTPPANIQLVKLGSELHGPEDAMYIEHDKVLFWENLKPDSKAIEAINKYKNNKK